MSSDSPDKKETRAGIVQSICRKIEEIDEVELEKIDLSEATDLTMDLQIDSASVMMLVFNLEEHFDVSIPLNELGKVRTIGDLAGLIEILRQTD